MSKMKQLNELVTELEGTATYFQNLITEFKKLLSTEDKQTEECKAEPPKEIKLEDVRAVLATKARDGFKDEVRGLLNKYDANSLSALDPKHYATVMEEAGGIGHG